MFLSFFTLLVFFFLQNYTIQAEKVAPTASSCSLQVAFTSQRTVYFDIKAVPVDLFATGITSLQGSRSSSQVGNNHGEHVQATMEMCMVQKTQQASCSSMWILLWQLDDVHRHSRRSWPEECDRSRYKNKIQKATRGCLGELGRIAAQKSWRCCHQVSSISKKENQRAHAQENVSSQRELWCSNIRSSMAIGKYNIFASAVYVDTGGDSRECPLERIGASTGEYRQLLDRRCPDSDRQDQEALRTAAINEISAAVLGQVGEEAQAVTASTNCAQQPSFILGWLHRRIRQAMENICIRLRRERPGFREESLGSKRRYAGSEREVREGERCNGQTGCSTARSGGGLRRHGGRIGGQNCHCGGNSTGHHQHGLLTRSSAHPPIRRSNRSRTSQQEGQTWASGRSARAFLVWCISTQAFSPARQIVCKTEVCPGHGSESCSQPAYPVSQWVHSILEEPTFLTEWKASISALDLSYEVSQHCGTVGTLPVATRNRSRSRRRSLQVTFSPIAELYVGYCGIRAGFCDAKVDAHHHEISSCSKNFPAT